jgi:hypothetical protein
VDSVEKLGVTNVVPSHMQEGDGFGVEHFEAMREYIRIWERELLLTKFCGRVGGQNDTDLPGEGWQFHPEV